MGRIIFQEVRDGNQKSVWSLSMFLKELFRLGYATAPIAEELILDQLFVDFDSASFVTN